MDVFYGLWTHPFFVLMRRRGRERWNLLEEHSRGPGVCQN